ncbi:MAG: PIN domain-containing protein [Candidatus Pacearchaeota archaeon]
MEVILDTNFLIYCAKEKLDYVEKISNLLNENYELVVPKQVIKELTSLKNDKFKKVSGKDKTACDLALKLLKFNKIKIVSPIGDSVDDAIINLSKEDSKNIVCTLDREMRHILGRVILLNKDKQLILTR